MAFAPVPDILAVLREFLETGLLPDAALSDDKRFNLRVAINLLATAERELWLGPAASDAEEKRLATFVGNEGSLDEKNRRLARAIREGAIHGGDPQLLEHLQQTVTDALRINNPKWIGGL